MKRISLYASGFVFTLRAPEQQKVGFSVDIFPGNVQGKSSATQPRRQKRVAIVIHCTSLKKRGSYATYFETPMKHATLETLSA